MPKEYELRLFDETLLTFTLEEKGIQGLVAHVTGVKSEKRSLLWNGTETAVMKICFNGCGVG